MIEFVKGELVELYNTNCECGIALLNSTLYIFADDYETVEIKPTKDTTVGGLEKQISKAIPHLMKLFRLEFVCEIIQSLMNMIEKRGLGHMGEDFNLRLISDWKENKYTFQGGA